MLRQLLVILILLVLSNKNAESFIKTNPNQPIVNNNAPHEVLQHHTLVEEMSMAQAFIFILETDLDQHKSEFTDEDYDILFTARKKLKFHKKTKLLKSAQLAFNTIRLNFENRDIQNIGETEFAALMVPVLEKLNLMNSKYEQLQYERVSTKLSATGKYFLDHVAIPAFSVHSRDIKVQWASLAAADPTLFKELYGPMLTLLQSFRSTGAISVEYYEQPMYLMGGNGQNDQMGNRQFGYRLINRKGAAQ
jgi:hypothetical protein